MTQSKTISEINKRIETGNATIMTADELKRMLVQGEKVKWSDIDVVTSATCGLMSGTTAVLSFQISGRGLFKRAKIVFLNDVPAYPGPCPNERLGILDLMVFGTAHSTSDKNYGGGHLFRDIVDNKSISVEVETDERKHIKADVHIRDIPFARIYGIRHCFKNYMAFLNRSIDPITSIFHVQPLKGPYTELSVCGCGELNPLENDPKLDVIGVGTKILLNDAEGFITSLGTRSSPEKPNLTGLADMHHMDPEYMGGFKTAEGPEVIMSWAVPIPILNEKVFKNVSILDRDSILPIADISDRIPFTYSDYGKIWSGTDITLKFDSKECLAKHGKCLKAGIFDDNNRCPVERICPTNAFRTKNAKLDRKLCFNCGACVHACLCGCFEMNMGELEIEGHIVPVTLRQSNRAKAIKLAKRLKNRILNNQFIITERIANLQ